MEKVTYILGAGFSAPLGLPIMSNFLIKSKDLYFSSPEKYPHFLSVFEMIENLSVIKNYYDANLFNIEEILSIIEMGNFLLGEKLKEEFLRYISDVISHYTPNIKAYQEDLPSNWYDVVFGDGDLRYYGFFVGNIFNLAFNEKRITDFGRNIRQFSIRNSDLQHANYAIITLNYDLVLERIYELINERFKSNNPISFNRDSDPGDWTSPPMAKLHGSIDIGTIVPPTWAKGTAASVTPIWQNAYKILRESNYIRFIGYSLPIADAYIKYLIKSAVVQAKHLKSIDVICLDPDGSVRARYDDFIKFDYYRYINADAAEYLKSLYETNKGKRPSGRGEPFHFNALEQVHETFMTRNL